MSLNPTVNQSASKTITTVDKAPLDSGFDDTCVSDKNENLSLLNRICISLSNSILQFPFVFEIQQNAFGTPDLVRDQVKKEIEIMTASEKDFKILDYGCGSGTYAGLFSADRYIGIDRNNSLVTRAAQVHKNHEFILASNLEKIHHKLTDVSSILMIGVVHHLSDKAFLSIIESMPRERPLKILTIDTLLCNKGLGKFIQLFERGEYLREEEDHLQLLSQIATEDSYEKVPYGKYFDLAVYRGTLK